MHRIPFRGLCAVLTAGACTAGVLAGPGADAKVLGAGSGEGGAAESAAADSAAVPAPATTGGFAAITAVARHVAAFRRVPSQPKPKLKLKPPLERAPAPGARTHKHSSQPKPEHGSQPKPRLRPAAATGAVSATESEPRAASASGTLRGLGHGLMLRFGYGESQWQCLDALWTRESDWSVTDRNASSGAYGIPQALPGSKMASAGADWRTDAATQISWGLRYIDKRYGTPCSAWQHSQRFNYY